MTESTYDEHVQFYVDFVDKGLDDHEGHLQVLMSTLVRLLGDRLFDFRVLDLACGEGYLGRFLVRHGAGRVIGIDLSAALVEEAERRRASLNLEYRVDDAHELRTVPDASVDVVVSQLALLDITDHQRVFRSVRRVLSESGLFLFSVLHPCFDGSPFLWPDLPKYVLDESGAPIALTQRVYASEGHWTSEGTGIRGRVGSYHRMISTYVNDLLSAGFVLERLEEPVLPRVVDRGPEGAITDLFAEIPLALLVAAQAVRLPASR